MIRTIGFYIFFFLRGFFSFFARWQANRVSMPTVEETDWIRNKVPRSWSSALLWIVGAKIEVGGAKNLPKGPVLFVANHVGSFDIPVLIAHLPKPFGFISKIEVLKIPVVGAWMKIMNCVFIDRKNRNDASKAITAGVDVLKNGHSLLIFPEGTRSKGGKMKPFKPGSLRLAMDANVPIIPIAIHGTADIMENNGNIMKPAMVRLTVLPALSFESFKDLSSKDLADKVSSLIEPFTN